MDIYFSFFSLSHVSCFPIFGLEIFEFLTMEMHYTACKGNVSAGLSTLFSICDGLNPSIFRRKMEKTRPMREERDGKVYFRQSRLPSL